jgi:hypothetical protein
MDETPKGQFLSLYVTVGMVSTVLALFWGALIVPQIMTELQVRTIEAAKHGRPYESPTFGFYRWSLIQLIPVIIPAVPAFAAWSRAGRIYRSHKPEKSKKSAAKNGHLLQLYIIVGLASLAFAAYLIVPNLIAPTAINPPHGAIVGISEPHPHNLQPVHHISILWAIPSFILRSPASYLLLSVIMGLLYLRLSRAHKVEVNENPQ